jgi:hypothetical protein
MLYLKLLQKLFALTDCLKYIDPVRSDKLYIANAISLVIICNVDLFAQFSM